MDVIGMSRPPKAALTELQTTLAILDPRPRASDLKPGGSRFEAEQRVEALLVQVDDADVTFTVETFLWRLAFHYEETYPYPRPIRYAPLSESPRRDPPVRKMRAFVARAMGLGLSWYYDEAQRAINSALKRF